MGRHWPKGTKLQLCGMSKSRELMGSMMTTVNNTVLSNESLLRG